MPDPKDLRYRARVHMDLPVRIRQIAPPRNQIEVTRTLDVSRNGILIRTREPYDMHSTVWITMHYRSDAVAPEPEFPGTVVRILRAPDGAADVALQFHSGRSDQVKTAAAPAPAAMKTSERRNKHRVRMALPIRVRAGAAAEESITLDVSRTGVLFSSARQYPVGQQVFVAMPYQPPASEEVSARVVRIVEQAGQRGVALEFAGRATPMRSW